MSIRIVIALAALGLALLAWLAARNAISTAVAGRATADDEDDERCRGPLKSEHRDV